MNAGSKQASRNRWQFLLVVIAIQVAGAQVSAQVRDHIFLPSTRGATALSTYIDAQANMIAAQGDFLEASAIARRHHAAAAEQEIKNSVEWVRAYFERKELNRAYRQKYNPTYIQRYEKSQRLKEHLLKERPELATAGDVTDELNLMLDGLSNHALAHQVVFGDETTANSSGQLSPEDVRALVLTDGTGNGNGQVTFRAERGSPLEFEWPMVFRNTEFDRPREKFDAGKKELLNDFRAGSVTADSWIAIQEAVNDLFEELDRQYPRARLRDSREYHVYRAAKRFLQAKACMVFQAQMASDAKYLTDVYVFNGNTVLDLVRHMTQHGLRFAPPEGDESGSYRKLFVMMRQLYLQYLGSES